MADALSSGHGAVGGGSAPEELTTAMSGALSAGGDVKSGGEPSFYSAYGGYGAATSGSKPASGAGGGALALPSGLSMPASEGSGGASPPVAPVVDAKAPTPKPKALATDSRGQKLDWAGTDLVPGDLHTKPKADKYIGEDKELGWRSPLYGMDAKSTAVTTRYDTTPEAQAKTRASIDEKTGAMKSADGKALEGDHNFVMSGGGAMHTFLDMDNKVTDAKGVESSGRGVHPVHSLRANPGGSVQGVHHTTPLGGADVAGAGAITASGGSLTKLTDTSGHYAPEAEYTHQTVGALAAQGASMSRPMTADGMTGPKSMDVELTGYNAGMGQGKKWIGEQNAGLAADSKMFEGDLSLPYQAFMTSGGNESQMRLKHTLNSQIKGAGGAGGAGLKPTPIGRAMARDAAGSRTDDAMGALGGFMGRADGEGGAEDALSFAPDAKDEKAVGGGDEKRGGGGSVAEAVAAAVSGYSDVKSADKSSSSGYAAMLEGLGSAKGAGGGASGYSDVKSADKSTSSGYAAMLEGLGSAKGAGGGASGYSDVKSADKSSSSGYAAMLDAVGASAKGAGDAKTSGSSSSSGYAAMLDGPASDTKTSGGSSAASGYAAIFDGAGDATASVTPEAPVTPPSRFRNF